MLYYGTTPLKTVVYNNKFLYNLNYAGKEVISKHGCASVADIMNGLTYDSPIKKLFEDPIMQNNALNHIEGISPSCVGLFWEKESGGQVGTRTIKIKKPVYFFVYCPVVNSANSVTVHFKTYAGVEKYKITTTGDSSGNCTMRYYAEGVLKKTKTHKVWVDDRLNQSYPTIFVMHTAGIKGAYNNCFSMGAWDESNDSMDDYAITYTEPLYVSIDLIRTNEYAAGVGIGVCHYATLDDFKTIS